MNQVIIDVALVLALTEVIKRIVALNGRWVPVVSLTLGVGLVFLGYGVSVESFLQGLIMGLTASGLYSSGKAVSGN